MAYSKQSYKNPEAGKPLISTISSACKTPVAEVIFSNLINAFYYPNSKIPRYSITCVFDPVEHKEFINSIQTIEKNEQVDTIIKNETEKTPEGVFNTGRVLLKFQSKDRIPVYDAQTPYSKNEGPKMIELNEELKKGERVFIMYDIVKYTKKNTMKIEHGLSFKPFAIYLFDSNKKNKGKDD